MQHEITERGSLLDANGQLREPGYATSLILDYSRQDIKAKPNRIKEWDYYLIANDRYGLALTISDNSYMGLDSISFLDFSKRRVQTKSPMQLFTKGRKHLSPTSQIGDVKTKGKDYSIEFRNGGNRRTLVFWMENFSGGKAISGQIELSCPSGDSMVIATPFDEDPLAFYYNQKINCMPASGKVRYEDKEYVFSPEDSYGLLDWGRGVWTKENTWYWASASGLIQGESFGFNIGYGFGNNQAATENMLFYKGKAHKLSAIKFNLPQKGKKDAFMQPWVFSSDDGRFEMEFSPILDRAAKTSLGFLSSNQHQVFGHFSGKAVLDNGAVIQLANFFGFAEKVHNKW